jgi:hypothetical protein
MIGFSLSIADPSHHTETISGILSSILVRVR